MIGYIVRRLGWSVVVLLAIAIATFVVTYLLPADPARMIAGIRATPEDVARIRHALGLDQPLPVQLVGYLARVAQGDFGHSYIQNKDVDTEAAAAKGEQDPAKRKAAYQDIQTKIMADAPWAPFRHQEWYTLVGKRVGGFTIHPVWQYDVRSLYIKPGA